MYSSIFLTLLQQEVVWWLGGDTEYPLAALPIKHVLGVTHFREAQK